MICHFVMEAPLEKGLGIQFGKNPSLEILEIVKDSTVYCQIPECCMAREYFLIKFIQKNVLYAILYVGHSLI